MLYTNSLNTINITNYIVYWPKKDYVDIIKHSGASIITKRQFNHEGHNARTTNVRYIKIKLYLHLIGLKKFKNIRLKRTSET